jgi:Ca2+-transporting ATPase
MMSGVTSFTPHAEDQQTVLTHYEVAPEAGLAWELAAERLALHGPNRLDAGGRVGHIRLLFRQFGDVLIWLLVVAAAVSGFLLGEWIEAAVIVAIVILNAALGFYQEARAEEALAALEALAAPRATVVRGGTEKEIAAEELVPGDIVRLEPGDLVPADLRLVEVASLEVDESLLTGESRPVAKGLSPVPARSALGDRRPMAFSGTTVVAGRGSGVVTATGHQTEVGQLAGLLTEDQPPTPLEHELKLVGWRLGALAVAVAVLIFGIGIVRNRPLESMFLLAVALAVAAIPEGLPAIVTLTLARGVQKMADRNAIVRRLPAVEALGAATVICTDKTGTLTRNEIWVQEADLVDEHLLDLSRSAGDPRVRRYLQLAVLCNDARRVDGGWAGDPTEIALLRSAEEFVDLDEIRANGPRVAEAGFDSERKRMSTLHQVEDSFLLAVKGAPEAVIPLCERFEDADGSHDLPADRRTRALDAAEEMAARGLRTLALAHRELTDIPSELAPHEEALILVAVVGMRDELRSEARQSVAEAMGAGIEVVMITGDHEVTAETIGAELGLLEGRDVMSGSLLADTSVEELAAGIDRHGVYARVDPAHKVKIIKAWQSRGHIVAMTGDGVNDAPALRMADIGVAMGSGTDVARQASDIVLTDDNFATIVRAVREGRTIYANLRKVVSFLLGSNISEVVVVFFGFLLWGGFGEPILATQLLWVNLVTDGLPALALGLDPSDPDVMSRPPRHGSVLGWRRQIRLLVTGLILAMPVLGSFAYGVAVDLPWEQVRTIGFSALVLTQLGYVYALKVGEGGWKTGLGGNRPLALAVAGSIVLQIMVVVTPLGNRLFDTVAIGIGGWSVAGGAAVLGALAVMSASTLLRRVEAE